jgi:hypothetical protein
MCLHGLLRGMLYFFNKNSGAVIRTLCINYGICLGVMLYASRYAEVTFTI